MASVLSLLFVSCSRDDIKTPNVAQVDARYETYYRLLAFHEMMEGKKPAHPTLLPRSGYSPGDVIDLIEGTMNMVS